MATTGQSAGTGARDCYAAIAIAGSGTAGPNGLATEGPSGSGPIRVAPDDRVRA